MIQKELTGKGRCGTFYTMIFEEKIKYSKVILTKIKVAQWFFVVGETKLL